MMTIVHWAIYLYAAFVGWFILWIIVAMLKDRRRMKNCAELAKRARKYECTQQDMDILSKFEIRRRDQ